VSISNEELEERANTKHSPVIEICKKGSNSSNYFHSKIIQLDPMNEVE
jgi:hypothetical protein